MLRPRIIPCLLIQGGGLVKTVRFREPKYVGDPLNAVRIFNEKQADELIVLDIDAGRKGIPPDLRLIGHMANECRMPLCYGGGVRTVEQAQEIISLGVEKVAISSGFFQRPSLVRETAQELGSQSVVVVMDVKRSPQGGEGSILTENATRDTGWTPLQAAREAQNEGAGEIVLNSVDRDGTMEGYDLDMAGRIRKEVNVPLTLLGGAGSLAHMQQAVDSCGVIGVAAGSFFVFKGPYRAVLISYPSEAEKQRLKAPENPGDGGSAVTTRSSEI